MRKFLLLLFFSSTLSSIGQVNEVLSSDRPGQALSTKVVGKNVFQLQPGIDFLNHSELFLPSLYVRFGLSDKVELNTNVLLEVGNGKSELVGFGVGTRISLNKQDSKTTSAIQITANLPVENLDFGTQTIYTIAGNFSENLGWTANIGANFDKKFNATGLYVLNLSQAFSNKLGVFLESFGTYQESALSFNFDTGLYYAIHNNFQLDAAIGDNDGLFFSVGATYRILPKNNKLKRLD